MNLNEATFLSQLLSSRLGDNCELHDGRHSVHDMCLAGWRSFIDPAP